MAFDRADLRPAVADTPPQHVDPAVVTGIAEGVIPSLSKIGRLFPDLKR
jgi:hypothetical protein